MQFSLVYGFLALFNLGFHDFHASIADITYRKDSKSIEIELRTFSDDMEFALSNKYSKSLDLITNTDQALLDSLTESYIKDNLGIEINSTAVAIEFLGTEIEDGTLYVYLELKNVHEVNQIEIKNSILMETFDDQSNLIHVEVNDGIKTLRLNKNQPSGRIFF